jgi:hypothetical protein
MSASHRNTSTVMRGATYVLRRLAVLVVLGLAVAVPAAAQTDPARLAVAATSDGCAGGRPVVEYTVTNQTSTPVLVQTWWVADASVYGIAASHDLGAAPDVAAGSFSLPFSFYATVTVYATATWPDGKVTTNASWAIPVADCEAPTSPPTTVDEPPTSTTATTIDDGGGGNGNGHGNGNGGNGRTPTTTELG